MSRMMWVWVVLLMLMCSATSSAQSLAGDWQGTLSGIRPLRLIVHVEPAGGSAWKATLASIDQSPDWGAALPADSVAVQGSSFKLVIGALRGSFDGTVSADGTSITGNWAQGTNQTTLTLVRATPESAWKDPAPHSARIVAVEP